MFEGRGRLTLSIVPAAAAVKAACPHLLPVDVLGLMLLEGAAGSCWVLGGCGGAADMVGAHHHVLWQGLHFHLRFACFLATPVRSALLLGVADILDELLVPTSASCSGTTPFFPYRVCGWRALGGSGGSGSGQGGFSDWLACNSQHTRSAANAQVHRVGRHGLWGRWAWLAGGGRGQHQLGAGADQMLLLAGWDQNLLAALHWRQEDAISRYLTTTSGEDEVGGGGQDEACLRTEQNRDD